MATIHKLTKDGATIFPATITDAVIHPQTGKTLTSMIKDYNVSELFPTEGIDGGNKYSLALAIQVLGTHLSAAQKTGGIRLTFISSVSPYPEEEYYLGKSSWSTVAADWDQRFEVGDVIADPSGSWEPGTAESYVDQKVATITGNLANETIARQTVDQSLQTQINAEATIRANVDNTKADKATTLAGYGITNAYTKTEVDDLVNTLVLITWSGLKALRDGGNLVAGQWYRITDYTCTTIQENTQSAGHAFDIIVRADSTNTLNENAYAAKHEGDTYFANSNLAAWKLKYTLDNIYWSSTPEEYITLSYGGSSRKAIYNGTEQINGTTYFRWLSDSAIGPSNKVYSISKNVGDTVYYYYMGSVGNISSIDSHVFSDVLGNGTITWMKDEYDNECPYDFKNIQFKVGAKSQAGTVASVFYYTFSVAKGTNDATVTDHSLNGSYCYSNRIGKWVTGSTQKLNFNVFRNTGTTNACNNNTFENNCHNNTFGNTCCNNTFENDCSYNTIGISCSSNTFENNCGYNTFENSCSSNIFGNECYLNIFGNNCSFNTFGNNCYNNALGNSCSRNTFGNYYIYNTLRDNCGYNTFGNECEDNMFGDNCSYNTFGNECENNMFEKHYCYYIIVENGNRYITLTSTQTTSGSNKLQNITIAQGFNNTNTGKTISHNSLNDTFRTTYGNIIPNVTYAQLVALKAANNLTPGQFYRIIDYTCTTIQADTQSAGHQFDIIVHADSTNTLNENAYAAKHEGDTYFANSNLAAWKLKYTLDNIYWSPEPSTTCTFQTTGGSSHNNIAYIGTEERNGTTWYKWDFSQYGHEIYSDYFYTEQLAAGDAYANSMGQWRKVGTVSNVVTISVQGKGTITWMKDEFDNECPYDFKNIQFKVGAKSQAGTVDNVFYYTFSMASGTNDATVTDYSLNGSSRGNRIGKWISGSTQKLNFNVFRNTNTIFTYDNNTFGNNCYNNTFGSSCQNNTFGDSCSSNTFGSYINNNTFGDGCSSNTFSAYNNNNMFGNNCYNNTFGGNDTNNTFGNGCSSNSFYTVCSFNKFEDNCDNNMFGDGCTNNSFGNNCAYNTFGHDCHYNSFGNDCRSIKFLKDCMQYNIVENGNKYIDVTSTQTTSSANTLRNITIAQGVNNTSTVKTISHNTVNDTFKTTYQAPNSQIISV